MLFSFSTFLVLIALERNFRDEWIWVQCLLLGRLSTLSILVHMFEPLSNGHKYLGVFIFLTKLHLCAPVERNVIIISSLCDLQTEYASI